MEFLPSLLLLLLFYRLRTGMGCHQLESPIEDDSIEFRQRPNKDGNAIQIRVWITPKISSPPFIGKVAGASASGEGSSGACSGGRGCPRGGSAACASKSPSGDRGRLERDGHEQVSGQQRPRLLGKRCRKPRAAQDISRCSAQKCACPLQQGFSAQASWHLDVRGFERVRTARSCSDSFASCFARASLWFREGRGGGAA